jgi:hypothetical protein
MDRIIAPLTDYDIFAYLMVGIAALAASDLILRTRFLIREKWDFGIGTMVIIAAYVAGQIVAVPSEWVLGRLITHQWLQEPAQHLVVSKEEYKTFTASTEGFDAACAKHRRKYDGLFYETLLSYFQPLSCRLQENIRKKEPDAEGRDLFSKAHTVARGDEYTRERLTTFSRLYIFSRNMSFVAFAAAFAVVIVAARGRPKTKPKASKSARKRRASGTSVSAWLYRPRAQFILFTAVGIALFYRYLLFYRLYSIEVLTAFSAQPPPG